MSQPTSRISLWAKAAALTALLGNASCGGEERRVVYPSPGAAGPVVRGQAEVGVVDPAGTRGLTGAAKDAYETGWKAWLVGDLSEARVGFQHACELDASAAAPRYSLGVVLEHLGDSSAAQERFRQAFEVSPRHEGSLCAYAVSLANTGRFGQADSFLVDRLSKAGKSSRLLTCAAEVKSIAKDHGGAQQLAQDALRIDPDYREAMTTIARDHYRARKLDLARYALQAILEGFGDATPPRDRDNAEAHLLRGLIFRESGARSIALADFEAASRKRPDLVEALVNLGSMRLEAGNAADALAPLESAKRYGPSNAVVHLNLGDCYRLLGRAEEAAKEFESALSIDSTLSAAHYDGGLLHLNAPSMPGLSPQAQVARAVKEFETYRTMRGPKAAAGADDQIDDLLNRAKAKQAEIRQTGASGASDTEEPKK